MSILSIYEAKQATITKFKSMKTYLSRIANSKVQSKLLDQATTANPFQTPSVMTKESEYDKDVITKYLN